MSAPRGWTVPIGAVVLIAIGLVLLLQNLGLVPWSAWLALLRFWPLLLIAIGLRMVLGRGLASTVAVSALLLLALAGAVVVAAGRWPGLAPELGTLREPRGATERLEAKLQFGAGDLRVSALPEGSTDLVVGEFAGGVRSTRRHRGATTALEVAAGPRWWPFWQPGMGGPWEVAFAREVPMELEVDAGAADLMLDLTELQVTRLDLDTGASSVEVRLPARVASGSVKVDAGAASILMVVPPDVAARIEVKGPLAGVNVDAVRFPKRGNTYESEGFSTAERRTTIRINAAASRVMVR